jgi:hypothetical protein
MSMGDNDLQHSDNFKLVVLPDGEIRLNCVCGVIVFSSIDYGKAWPVSLATLIEAAEEHEATDLIERASHG